MRLHTLSREQSEGADSRRIESRAKLSAKPPEGKNYRRETAGHRHRFGHGRPGVRCAVAGLRLERLHPGEPHQAGGLRAHLRARAQRREVLLRSQRIVFCLRIMFMEFLCSVECLCDQDDRIAIANPILFIPYP